MVMVHAAVGLVLFAGLMVITALLFSGWLAVIVGRWMWRVLVGGSSQSLPQSRGVLDTRMCARDRCRAPNPVGAQFCRRCGTALNESAQRRVAV